MIVGKLYRFKDLAQIGVRNYPTLYRWIETQGFPKGRLLGENTRVWTEAELQSWFDSRPTDPPPDLKERPANLLAEGGRPVKASAGNQSNSPDNPIGSLRQPSSNGGAA
jgi:predicted DNA-binding transcriptional regulator AlpA